MSTAKPKPGLWSAVITQAIALAVCLGIPLLVTWMAPRTTIQLRWIDGVPAADITKYVLLVAPLPTDRLEPLQQVESIVTAEKKRTHLTSEDKRRGRGLGTTFADGSLKLGGAGRECWIQSTPQSAPSQAETIQAFLDNPAAEPLAMTATAPWPLTYLLGGIMTGLATFYLVGVFLAISRWCWKNRPLAR